MTTPSTEAQSASHQIMLHCSGRLIPNQSQIEELIDLAFAKQRSDLTETQRRLADYKITISAITDVVTIEAERAQKAIRELHAAQAAAAEMRYKIGVIAHSLGQARQSSPDEMRAKVAVTFGMVNELLHIVSTCGTGGTGWLSPQEAESLRFELSLADIPTKIEDVEREELRKERDNLLAQVAAKDAALRKLADYVVPNADAFDKESPMMRGHAAAHYDWMRNVILAALSPDAGSALRNLALAEQGIEPEADSLFTADTVTEAEGEPEA